MAITLLELSKQLQSLSNDLNTGQLGNVMAQLGSDATVLVRRRVQETGKNADGSSFPAYSTKPMLAGRGTFKTQAAFNKVAGSKKKRSELEWVTVGGSGFSSFLSAASGGDGPSNTGGKHLFILPGGYKELRDLHGRQTAFVDFTWSGNMWNNIKVTSDRAELDTGVAIIKATLPLEQKKLAGLTKRKGEILELSKSEIGILSKNYSIWVNSILAKNKLL
jgi:hypothetical protein